MSIQEELDAIFSQMIAEDDASQKAADKADAIARAMFPHAARDAREAVSGGTTPWRLLHSHRTETLKREDAI